MWEISLLGLGFEPSYLCCSSLLLHFPFAATKSFHQTVGMQETELCYYSKNRSIMYLVIDSSRAAAMEEGKKTRATSCVGRFINWFFYGRMDRERSGLERDV